MTDDGSRPGNGYSNGRSVMIALLKDPGIADLGAIPVEVESTRAQPLLEIYLLRACSVPATFRSIRTL